MRLAPCTYGTAIQHEGNRPRPPLSSVRRTGLPGPGDPELRRQQVRRDAMMARESYVGLKTFTSDRRRSFHGLVPPGFPARTACRARSAIAAASMCAALSGCVTGGETVSFRASKSTTTSEDAGRWRKFWPPPTSHPSTASAGAECMRRVHCKTAACSWSPRFFAAVAVIYIDQQLRAACGPCVKEPGGHECVLDLSPLS